MTAHFSSNRQNTRGRRPRLQLLRDAFLVAVRVFGIAAHTAWENGTVARPWPAAESGAAIVVESLLDIRSRVHDEGPVLHDGLADRPALQQEQLALFVSVLQGHFD